MKREIFWVEYSRKLGAWTVRGLGCVLASGFSRKESIAMGRKYARADQPSQLRIRSRKTGRVVTEHTYGADPRRFNG